MATVRDYTYALTDYGLEPMFSLADGGTYTCPTFASGPCAGTGSIILGDHANSNCTSTGCTLGWARNECWLVNSISNNTCSVQYSEIAMSTQANWAYTTYTTDSRHSNFGQALAHEIGHALGLDHPVRGPNSGRLMQCVMANGEALYPNLDSDTMNGMAFTYSRYSPSLAGTPTVPPC